MGVWDTVGLCFLLLFLFFCSSGFGVLLWGFWCETVVGGALMVVGSGGGLWVVVGVVGFFILYFYILLIFLMLF